NVTAVYARSAPTRSGNTHQLPVVGSRPVPSRNAVFTARDQLLDVKVKVRKRFDVHLHRLPGAISATSRCGQRIGLGHEVVSNQFEEAVRIMGVPGVPALAGDP